MRGSHRGPGPGLALVLGLVVWACAPASPSPSATAATASAPTNPSPTGSIQAATPSPVRVRADLRGRRLPRGRRRAIAERRPSAAISPCWRTGPIRPGPRSACSRRRRIPPVVRPRRIRRSGARATSAPITDRATTARARSGSIAPSTRSTSAATTTPARTSSARRSAPPGRPSRDSGRATPSIAVSSLEAVTACRDRLVGEGIDLSAYDVAATVGDLEDLRQALGLSLVNVNANLNGSRISSEYVRTYPDAVRVVHHGFADAGIARDPDRCSRRVRPRDREPVEPVRDPAGLSGSVPGSPGGHPGSHREAGRRHP